MRVTGVKALTVWAGILVLAIANGLLREAVLVPQLGRVPGFVLSGLLLALVILGVACLTLPWFGRGGPAKFAAIGSAWLVLTLAFEFG